MQGGIPSHKRGSDRLFHSSGRGVGTLLDGGISLHARLWDGMHGSVVSGKQKHGGGQVRRGEPADSGEQH